MKKYIPRVSAAVLLVLGALVVLVGNDKALAVGSTMTNNANTLKISPVRTDITIAPGTSRTVKMKVTNITKSPMAIHPIENDFIAGDEKGTPALILDENKYAPTHSLKRFMVPLKDVTIAAGATQEIPLKINVPADAKAGGYYGAVRFAPASGDNSKSVNLNASAASIVLLTVPGNMIEQLDLTDFNIEKDSKTVSGFVSDPEKMSLDLRFENKGSVQAAPFGQVYVKEGDKVLYTKDFNQANPRDMVLPDSARRWDVPLDKLGKFGKYTIGATFTYGTTNKSIEISKTIWVIPTLYIIIAVVALLVLIALVIGVVFFLRGYKQRVLRKHGGGGFGIKR